MLTKKEIITELKTHTATIAILSHKLRDLSFDIGHMRGSEFTPSHDTVETMGAEQRSTFSGIVSENQRLLNLFEEILDEIPGQEKVKRST